MKGSRLVLVVEDDWALRDLIRITLEADDLEVRTTAHGAAALEEIRRQQPDLILLDMRMPVMDGWAFAWAYRQTPGPHAPIVVFTAARDAAQRAAEIGAERYLGKPFELEDLVSVVEHHLFAAGDSGRNSARARPSTRPPAGVSRGAGATQPAYG